MATRTTNPSRRRKDPAGAGCSCRVPDRRKLRSRPLGTVVADGRAFPAVVSAPRAAERGSDPVVLGCDSSCCCCGRPCCSCVGRGPAVARSRAAAAPALRPGDVSHLDLRVLGLVLAAGLRLRLASGRAAGICLRLRHAAVVVAPRQLQPWVRPASHHFQHQPVSVVQGRLVLPAVPAGRRRFHGQGVRAVAS